MRSYVQVNAYHSPFGVLEYFYDVCLVLAPAYGRDHLVFKGRGMGGGAHQLGDRAVRILPAGAGQPAGLPGERRAFFTDGIESVAGGNHFGGLHAVHAPVL